MKDAKLYICITAMPVIMKIWVYENVHLYNEVTFEIGHTHLYIYKARYVVCVCVCV